MADGGIASEAFDHSAVREIVAHKTKPTFGMKPLAVKTDNAGGFLIAFSEVALTYPWKKIAEYLGFEPTGLLQMLGTEYKLAISFVILIVVLLVRPTGLFRGKAY